jgi:hypothetical protein
MAESTTGHDSPLTFARESLRSAWRSTKTVYYANSVSWRVLKSGALLFMGFFLWSSSNLLLSYQPTWTWLRYPMAYGFVLVWYGPVHHVVVIPLSLRLRKRVDDWSRVGRRLPTSMLVLFLVAVVVLGTFPAGPMTFEFGGGGGGAADIDPVLTCSKSTDAGTVHCHLEGASAIDQVVVESGGDRLAVDREAPFEFTVETSGMTEVAGQKQFQVVMQDENGNTIRRYTRTVSMIPA